MTRYTHEHDPQPEPHEIEAFTQPDIRLPDDGKWEWVLWVSVILSGLGISYGVIKVIGWIFGGIFSW